MKEINEKEISDFAEIGNLVQEYINDSLSGDALTASADAIKYKIDDVIQQRYGAEDLDKAKLNMATKVSMERIDRARNSAQSDFYQEEMRKYDPSRGGMDLTLYNNEKANYDFYQNEMSHNNDNISRFNEDLKGLTNKGVNLGYGVLKNAGEIVSLYQLGEAYYKDDQNEIAKTATALGIGMVVDVLATTFLTTLGAGAVVTFAVPIAIGAFVGFAASKFWDNFEVGKKIGMNPGESFFDPLIAVALKTRDYFFPSLSKAENTSSPIILDLDGDGVETLSLSNGVYFDHDANSFAEKSGWVSADDGLLVLDIDNNGQIDSGRELFGNNTYLKDGTLAKNGYLALQELDDDHNGEIDHSDSIWQQLKIWQDKNSNGIVDSGEMSSLDDMNISSISTRYQESAVIDENNNAHRQESTVEFNDGTHSDSADVWFAMNRGDTRYKNLTPLAEGIAALPFIGGFGNITNLHTAMNENSELRTLMEQYVANPTSPDITDLIDRIIFAWAGVSATPENSRGSYIDARKIIVLEMTTGEKYLNKTNDTTDPYINAAVVVNEEYQNFHNYVSSMLVMQTVYREVFSLITPDIKDDFSGFTLNFSTFNTYLANLKEKDTYQFLDIVKTASSLLVNSTEFAGEMAVLNQYTETYIVSTAANETLTAHYNNPNIYLFSAGHGQDIVTESASKTEEADTLRFTGARAENARFSKHGSDLIIQAYGAEDSVTLSNYFSSNGDRYFNFAFDDKILTLADIEAMNMTVNGTAASDSLNGWSTSDTLTGGAGNDTLYGNEGHDILDGGTGNDRLYGGYNESDTYLFAAGHGQDIVTESASKAEQADTLRFTGARAENARFSKHGSDLIIQAFGAEESVTLSNYFSSNGDRYFNFAFDDKILTLADIEAMNMTVNGTAASDSLNGWSASDTITGGAGNDTLYGNEGHDILDGGTGNDRLYGGYNESDTYLFAAGHGQDIVTESASKAEQADTLRFTGARAENARFSNHNSDLIIQAYGAEDSVTLSNYFSSNGDRYFNFAFDDKILTLADIEAMNMTVNGTAASDSLNGWSASDTITGGAGNDSINGLGGDDILAGGEGNDTLYGNEGHDILDGGTGNDRLYGGYNESDTYLFAAGHGQDIVTESASKAEQADTLRFTGARAENARFSKHGSDLIIQAFGAEESVTLSNYFSSNGDRYFNFAFDDKILTLADIEAMNMTVNGTAASDSLNGWSASDTLTGGAGNDTLYGNEGHDILDGGTGNDRLYGGYNESDTYLFAAGHGQDIVTESASKAEQADTLRFTGARAENARFSKHGSDLIIQAFGAEESVTLSNYFSSNGDRYFNFAFDDKILTLADIEAMNMTVNGTAASDSLNGWSASDTLTGGAGNDILNGSAGSDTYLFAKGHNQDVVTDSMQNSGDIDSIQFTDASVQDLWFSRSNSHLLISEIGSNDSVTLDNWFYGSAYQNKVICIADGQSLEATQLQQLVDAMAVFSAGQSVTAMQPDQMRASMQMINSSDYWSHS